MDRATRAWLVALGLVVAALLWVNWGWERKLEEAVPGAGLRAERVSIGKLALVTRAMGEIVDRSRDVDPLFDQLAELEDGAADRIYRAILVGEVEGANKALAVLEPVPDEADDVALLRRLYRGEPLPGEEADSLAERRGWYGRLAAAFGQPVDDPGRAAILGSARRGAFVMMALTSVAIPAGLAGFVLFVMFLVRAWKGQTRARFALHDQGSGDLPWLQTTVIGLAGILALNVGWLNHIGLPGPVAMWLLLLPVFWPLLRSMKVAEWRGGLGLLRGTGVAREMGAGAIGYLGGVPIILLGLLVSQQLIRLTGSKPAHPVQYEVLGGDAYPAWIIVVSACVWAPVVEELLFRGAFYRFLRPRWSWVGAVAVSGLLFGVVHPQGVSGVPSIWALGIVFALVREWRGSIVASMTAHALHNGVAMVFVLGVFR
ncbi:MAG: lysostaphin resistance A-like protein [Planctomycetota bacterium]|jgi:membrane protease YdiL (CAAX protease family)